MAAPPSKDSKLRDAYERRVLARCFAFALFTLIAAYSLFYATHCSFRFAPLAFMDHYSYQANGFWNFRLDLCNDAGAPIPVTMDSVNFKGRTYGAYGPFPAIFQLLLNKLFRLHLTSGFIVWVLALATLCALFLLARDHLTLIYGFRPAAAIILAASLCTMIGVGDRFLQQVIVPFAWTQAGLSGALFFTLSIWLILRHSKSRRPFHLWTAGLFYGFALLSKQNYLFGFVPVILFVAIESPAKIAAGRSERFWNMVRISTPIALCLACTLLWNYARFGNPFESGIRYVNATGTTFSDFTRPMFHRVPYNFYNHFIAGISLRPDDLPIGVGLSKNFGGIDRTTGYGGLQHNFAMFSLFISLPVLVISPIYLLFALRQALRRSVDERVKWNSLLLASSCGVFALYLLLDSSFARYQYDIVLFWSLCSVCAMLDFHAWLQRRVSGLPYSLVTAGLAALFIAAILWQTLLGVDQSFGILASRGRPFIHWSAAARASDAVLRQRAQLVRGALFDRIGPRWVDMPFRVPLPDASPAFTVWHSDRGSTFVATGSEWIQVREPTDAPILQVRFPAWHGPHAEPLLTRTLGPGRADGVGLRYLSPSGAGLHVAFFLDHWGSPPACVTDALYVTPEKPYSIAVDLNDELSELRLWLDGREILACKTLLYWSDRMTFSCGKNAAGFTTFDRAFTGQIVCPNLPSDRAAAPTEAVTVRFPSWRGPHAEPLVIRGTGVNRADGVGVRYLAATASGINVSFFLDHWGTPIPCATGATEIVPGRPYTLAFEFNEPLSRFAIWLGDRQILACKTALYPAGRKPIACGSDRLGFSTFEHNFTGHIVCTPVPSTPTPHAAE